VMVAVCCQGGTPEWEWIRDTPEWEWIRDTPEWEW